jgi:pimeloyl-ACP methyl ester carboxylesterase
MAARMAPFCPKAQRIKINISRGYSRIVLDGIGHFPTREAPEVVADAILKHIA